MNVALEHPHTLGGFPVPRWKEGVMDRLPPKVITSLGEKGILFLDDFAAAEPQQQRVSLSLTTYRTVGDYKLPEGIRVVFASNRIEDFSYVIKPSFAILNRCKHYILYPSLEDWNEWLCERGVPVEKFSPSLWGKFVPTETAAIVSTFLKFFPQFFFSEPSELDTEMTVSYPTPRSWTNFIRDLGLFVKENGYPEKSLMEILQSDEVPFLLSAWVGTSPLLNFTQFLSVDMKILDEVMKKPEILLKMSMTEQSLYTLFWFLSVPTEERDRVVSFATEKLHPEVRSLLVFFLSDREEAKRHRLWLALSALTSSESEDKVKKKKSTRKGG